MKKMSMKTVLYKFCARLRSSGPQWPRDLSDLELVLNELIHEWDDCKAEKCRGESDMDVRESFLVATGENARQLATTRQRSALPPTTVLHGNSSM